MYRTLAIFLFLSLTTHSLMSQELNDYRWQNRLVIVLADDCAAEELEAQINILQHEKEGLAERKIHVICLTPKQRRDGTDGEQSWQASSLYQQYRRASEGMEVLLIGLDGGTKLRQTEVLTTEKLFALIDGMPMRRAEVRKKER